MRGIVLEVAHDAGHLDLVHRVDQPGGRAGLPEDIADIGDFGDRGAFTVQRLGHLDAEQALLAQLRERLAGKACFGVHRRRVGAGHIRGGAGTGGQVALPRAWRAGPRYSVCLDCHLKLALWPCNRRIMRGRLHLDNDSGENILLLSDARLILKTYVKPASYSVSCARRYYRP